MTCEVAEHQVPVLHQRRTRPQPSGEAAKADRDPARYSAVGSLAPETASLPAIDTKVEVAEPDLSVVIVTHNGRELALATIESAMARLGDVAVEWVVVDSGSTDDTPMAIELRWPGIQVIRVDNIGFAAANNVGFRVARGRYVLALNPDTEVRWGRFQTLVEAMDERPRVGAASVIQEESEGHFQCIRRDPSVRRALGEALLLRHLPGLASWQERELDQGAYSLEREADWLVGAVLLLRREALADVAGFDERFFMYSEEADLCRRVRESGWEVRHLPVMQILHHGGAPSPRLTAQAAFSRIEYAAKHFGRLHALAYRAVVALHYGLRLAGIVARRGSRDQRKGMARALKVALGIAPPPFDTRPASGHAPSP